MLEMRLWLAALFRKIENWSLSGSVSVTKSITATIGYQKKADWGHQIKSEFRYLKQRQYCPFTGATSKYRVIVGQWLAGIQFGADVSAWDNAPGSVHKSSYPPGGHFNRISGRAYNYNGAVCVFGACLNAQSGFSSNISLYWENQSPNENRYLYGNNGLPITTSGIIYASWHS